MIYLDNAGTTKMFKECAQVHECFSCEQYFNPSAPYSESLNVSKQISQAERYILQQLGATQGDVLFTGCATESNNLAICGSVRNGDWEYVFSAGEHPSVFNVAKKLQNDGRKVHIIPLAKNGQVDFSALESVLNEKTRLISIIHVSNETGAVNDIAKISALKKRKCPHAILHMDGVQAFKKIPINLKMTEVDLYSFSGHKIHAPKGIAGLYVKNKNLIKPIFEGGGQQFGLRSGTENVSGIMQLQKAISLIDVEKNLQRVKKLKNTFNEILSDTVIVKEFGENCDGDTLTHSPYIENLIFPDVKGETMLNALNAKGVIVGLGSACSSKTAGNRILEAIGLYKDKIISSVRVSFNAYMTDEEVALAAKTIKEVYLDIKERVN